MPKRVMSKAVLRNACLCGLEGVIFRRRWSSHTVAGKEADEVRRNTKIACLKKIRRCENNFGTKLHPSHLCAGRSFPAFNCTNLLPSF
jgi:hypothetical protein